MKAKLISSTSDYKHKNVASYWWNPQRFYSNLINSHI